MFGKTLGIIGLGHIGAAIARRGFYGFNMNILYHNRREKIEVAQAFNAQYRNLDQLLQQSDFIVVAVDLNHDSQALIGEAQFGLMQKHAVFINIARVRWLMKMRLLMRCSKIKSLLRVWMYMPKNHYKALHYLNWQML